MRTKKGQKQKLWARVVITQGRSIKQTGIDFPVTLPTTLGDFGELEAALNNMFAPVKFDLEYHWENVDG